MVTSPYDWKNFEWDVKQYYNQPIIQIFKRRIWSNGVTRDVYNLVMPMHNVLFVHCNNVQYIFLPTEQAETYLKKYAQIYYLTYICPSLSASKANMIFEETVIFKL